MLALTFFTTFAQQNLITVAKRLKHSDKPSWNDM